MKTILRLFGVVLLLTVAATACSDLMKEHTPERELSQGTRASDFEATDYYWAEGERIPIQRMNDKFYVVFYSADEERFRNELSKAGIGLSNILQEFDSHPFYTT